MFSGFDNPLHLLIIGILVLLLFGAKRLPEIGRSLGSGMREFSDTFSGRSRPETPPPATPVAPPAPAPAPPVASEAAGSEPPLER